MVTEPGGTFYDFKTMLGYRGFNVIHNSSSVVKIIVHNQANLMTICWEKINLLYHGGTVTNTGDYQISLFKEQCVYPDNDASSMTWKQ